MNQSEMLGAADAMLDDGVPDTTAIWPRSAAVLTRAAIEATCDIYWRRKSPPMARATMRQQWLALPCFLGRDPTVAQAEYAWAVLSSACHQRAYDVGLTEAELRAHIHTAGRFFRLVSTRITPREAAAAGR